MTKKSPIANEADPQFLKRLADQAEKQSIAPRSRALRPVKADSDLITYPQALQATSGNAVTITQSVNNNIGDVVTVYRGSGEISVTAIDQTINEYTTVDSGVSRIIAGENIIVTSTSGNGVGTVTISGSAGNIDTSRLVNGNSNVQVYLNGPITMSVGSVSNVVVINNNSLNVHNINITNSANLGNSATANYFIGDGGLLTNIANVNFSNTANFSETSNIANFASTANFAETSNLANFASTTNFAETSNIANFAETSNLANFSETSNIANFASTANFAETSNLANFSSTANFANYVDGGNIIGNVGNSNYAETAGTVVSNNQPNITSVGTLISLDVTGNVSAAFFIGDGGLLSNLPTGGGNYSNSNVANYLPIYDGLLSAGNLNVSGTANAAFFIGDGGLLSNITTDTALNANYANFAGNVVNNLQPNITSLGVLTELNVSGISNLGNIENVKILGGNSGQVIATNGLGDLYFIDVSGGNGTAIINGTSSVVVEFNGNINATVSGEPNVVQLTSNGTNIEGNVNLNGELIIGNGFAGAILGADYIESENFVFKKFNQTVVSVGNVSGTIQPDASLGTIYKYVLTGNVVLNNLSNSVAGTTMIILLQQDSVGGHELVSNWYWSGNNRILTSTANAIDIVEVFFDGVEYYAKLNNNYQRTV